MLPLAQVRHENHDGKLPSDRESLLKIPGIGPYTAGAISSIAFGNCDTLVDGNVIRVFSRLARDKRHARQFLIKGCWALAVSSRRNRARQLQSGSHGARRDCMHAQNPQMRIVSSAPPLPRARSRSVGSHVVRRFRPKK